MKKKSLMIVFALIMCGTMLTNCGGNGSGSNSSKLKKNEYLGNLPALYENYETGKDALEKKTEAESEKLLSGGEKNYSKIQKLFDDQKIKEKEMKEKFNADVKAELAKIVGKEVPVSFSDKLKNSDKFYFNVSDVKIVEQRGEPRISFTITAKDDFTVQSMKGYDYNVYFRLIGADGATLENSTSTTIPISLSLDVKSFKKGDVLLDSYNVIGFNLGRYAVDRANFSGIEFISKEEYNEAAGL